jgi:hypothetical protein
MASPYGPRLSCTGEADLQMVERVTGRLTKGRAAAAGALSGKVIRPAPIRPVPGDESGAEWGRSRERP